MTLSTSSQEKTVVPEIQAGSGILEEPKEPEVPLAVEEDYEIVEPDHHDGPEDQAKETTQNADQILEVPEISNVSEEFAAELLPVLTVDKDGIKIASAGDVNGTIDPEEQHGTPEAKDTVIQAQDLEERPLIQGQKVHESEPLQDHSVTKTPVEDHPASEVKEPETAKEDHRELSEQVASGVQDDKADSTPSSESVHCDKAEESKSEDHLAKHDETIPITQDVSTPSESHNFTCNVETEQPNAEDELTKNDQTAAIAEDKVEDAAKVERKTSDVTQDTSESQEKNIPEENSEIAAVPELAVDTKENSVEPKREALECADSTTLQTSRCDVSACKPRAAEDHPAEAAAKHSADNEIQEVALDNTALEPEISAEASIPAIPNEHSTTEESKPIENDFISSIQETVEVIEPGEANLNSNETSEAEALETSETAENPDSNEATPAQPVSIPTIVIAESSPPPTAPQLASIQEESELQTTQVVAMSNSPTAPPRKLSPSNSPSSPSSPVAPPRRPSTIGVGGTMSRSASRATIIPKSTSSGSLTLNRAGSQGRLLFNTLPRNAHPPTREEAGKKKRSMFSWLGGNSSKKNNKEVLETVSEGLRKVYKQKLYPLEEHYKFHEFHSPALDDPDFDAKPMILLVGQYSTGKTTFIRHILEKDFPGIRIGPEPTTDRFIAVMHGDEEGVIPGNALVVDAKKQFRALSGFGNAFLNRFQCSTLPNQVLESVTIVDTPGILSGEKQRIDRGYDFTGVLEWFAERVDRIILLFDAHKLDISDEFKRCIEALAGNEDKIRIVLNKSDMVDHQQLMRVYGALMWSLGKVFRTPEVSRVYLGSFWDHPLHYDINRRLFQDEQHDLFQDLQALPRNAALRKLNDLIKRARLAKVHAYIIAELRKQMPSMIGKEKKKKELIQNLDKIYEQLQREHNISPGDFPDVNKMREKLQNQDFTKFQPIKPKLLEVVDGMLASDIARLMAQIPKEEQVAMATNGHVEQPSVRGGAFAGAQEAETPFGFGRGEGFDKGANENDWVVSRERNSADSTFESLGPIDGFVSGRAAKEHMVKSKLPNAVLGKIWKLADVDKDGQLDSDEFALANYLINLKLEGHELPAELPDHLIPPSKREQVETVYPNLGDDE